MAKRHPLKITVLKKLSAKEVYGKSLPEVAEDMSVYCKSLSWKSRGPCPLDFALGPGMTSFRP
jgi:hypothetical protein